MSQTRDYALEMAAAMALCHHPIRVATCEVCLARERVAVQIILDQAAPLIDTYWGEL